MNTVILVYKTIIKKPPELIGVFSNSELAAEYINKYIELEEWEPFFIVEREFNKVFNTDRLVCLSCRNKTYIRNKNCCMTPNLTSEKTLVNSMETEFNSLVSEYKLGFIKHSILGIINLIKLKTNVMPINFQQKVSKTLENGQFTSLDNFIELMYYKELEK